MDSFALLYKDEKDSDEKPKFDLHVNLWSFNRPYPFIDIGLKINNCKSIKKIIILMPFDIKKENINDLSAIIGEKIKICSLIFNDSCSLDNKAGNVIKIGSSDCEYLIYKLDDNKVINENRLEIDIENNNFKNLYIRFRIESSQIKKMLYRKIEDPSVYMKGYFTYTEIIDLKFNKKRNIKNLTHYQDNGYKLMKFKKIHFLIMEPINHLIEAFGKNNDSCRTLEPEWSGYLGEKIGSQEKLKNMLAHHWKEVSGNSEDGLEDYGITLKITSPKTNGGLIAIYLGIGCVSGIISALIQTAFTKRSLICNWIINNRVAFILLIIFIIFFCLFLYIKKRKKKI